jgi:hypothetical protein
MISVVEAGYVIQGALKLGEIERGAIDGYDMVEPRPDTHVRHEVALSPFQLASTSITLARCTMRSRFRGGNALAC